MLNKCTSLRNGLKRTGVTPIGDPLFKVRETGGWKHGTCDHAEDPSISNVVAVAPAASAPHSRHLFCCETDWLKGWAVTSGPNPCESLGILKPRIQSPPSVPIQQTDKSSSLSRCFRTGTPSPCHTEVFHVSFIMPQKCQSWNAFNPNISATQTKAAILKG